jgi:hypothetical protein
MPNPSGQNMKQPGRSLPNSNLGGGSNSSNPASLGGSTNAQGDRPAASPLGKSAPTTNRPPRGL